MKKNFFLALAAGVLLLAGCGTTTNTIEAKDGKTTLTYQRDGKVTSTWELKQVLSAGEKNQLRKEGWKYEGLVHNVSGPDTYLMKRRIIAVSVAPPVFQPMFISTLGTNVSNDGLWRISVASDSVDFTRTITNGITTGTGFTPDSHWWQPKHGWFVFVENDSRVWAYDGGDKINLATFGYTGGAIYYGHFSSRASGDGKSPATNSFTSNFPCPLPAEVIAHLPEGRRQELRTQ